MEPVVRFDSVSKKFRRGEVHQSLRDWIASRMGRATLRNTGATGREFWALRDVSFDVAPGETVGIIGPNGAGKSTALKLLAGILRCDAGAIFRKGRLAALIEVNAGMHGDLTGLENIYLNGAIMGMSRAEIRRNLDDIIAFSGLEEFIHTPVKRYSTGMQARLGFSTAVHVSPDVLLVDEVLSVGDVAFRQRCQERMVELVERGAALVFVTHNLDQMRAICDRALVLDHGETQFCGPPADAVGHYLSAVMNRTGELSYADQPRTDSHPARRIELAFQDRRGVEIKLARADAPLHIRIAFETVERIARLSVETAIRRHDGQMVLCLNSAQQGVTYDVGAGRHRVDIHLPAIPLAGGNYLAMVRLWDTDRARLAGETPYRFALQIDDRGKGAGLLALPHQWSSLGSEAAAPPESELTPAYTTAS